MYGRNCHACPVVVTHTTLSHASAPNFWSASVLSTMKYLWTVPVPAPWAVADGADEALVEDEKAAAEAVGGSRRRSMWRRSSARGFPAAAARSRAVVDGSKLGGRCEYLECTSRQAHRIRRISKGWVTYTASCKKRFTLYMVISAVGDDEIMMIGNMFSVQKTVGWEAECDAQRVTYWFYALAWAGRRMAQAWVHFPV